MRHYGKKFWRSVPFLRLLIPLTAGVLIEQYFPLPITAIIITAMVFFCMYSSVIFLPIAHKYRYRVIAGWSINMMIFCFGSALMYFQNIENDKNWTGHFIKEKETVLITLQEPLIEKPNSFKALAKAESVLKNGKWQNVKGNLLIYFKKDSSASALQYGSQLIITKTWQPITNSGNPGGFDYKKYCASQDIYFQVYLQPNEYKVLDELKKNWLTHLLINTRNNVLSLFRKWVPGQRETGVAEALLIGYRDDLDKELVQSYSNTGVVHIIAISGLHLGMIYGLMVLILKPFRKIKWIKFIKPVAILLVLWGFSLLAGAAASILRSAVMFSFIVIGESLGRKTNIYNTLAASAFCLLVYNPYFFWDVGFQLSYAAVLSIILFMKPIYRQFYFTNKILNTVWQLNAVTLSAQVLTLPIILYYFHQFPNLFLFTNFIAVPLSGFILYGELLLLIVAKIPFLNLWTGKIISFLIAQMDSIIERTDRIPYSVTDNIHVGLTQTILLYFAICYIAFWLLYKKTNAFIIGLSFICLFFFIASYTQFQQKQQHKLIVYNIPKHAAIDVIEGAHYLFTADINDPSLEKFHMRPSRLQYGVTATDSLFNTFIRGSVITGRQKTVLIISKPTHFAPVARKIPVDIIILSGNPKIYLSQLATVFDCKQWVFDSSNPLWKIRYWKKDADSLHLRHHSVSEQGAFEADL
jgi:competence protein ComEC